MSRYFLLLLLLFPAAHLHAAPTDVPLSLQQQTPSMQPVQPAPGAEPELFDIKGPIELPDNSRTVTLAAAAAAALLLVIIIAVLWRKRSGKKQAALAHEIALQQLLRAEQLIAEQEVEGFVTLIDQTLRSYIEQRFAVSARRQTTREFITGITAGTGTIPEPLARNTKNLQTWLGHCDLVKFARAGLSPETMTEMLANLRSFIESTRVEPEK